MIGGFNQIQIVFDDNHSVSCIHQLLQYINQLTQGRVAVGAGTLYALLARFEEEQLIILTHTKEGRKYYALSDKGKRTLQAEFDRLNHQLTDGAQVLEGT